MNGYLTKSEAARRLGISERTLERMTAKGKGPSVRLRPRAGNRPEPMYRERDVENLLHAGAEVMPAPAVPAVATVASSDVSELHRSGPIVAIDWRPVVALFQPLVTAASEALRPAPPPAPVQQWITPAEASSYLGLSEACIRGLIRRGKLPYLRSGHSYMVKRSDLDNLAGVTRLAEVTQELRETVKSRRAG